MEKPEKCIDPNCGGLMLRDSAKENEKIKKHLTCMQCARVKLVLTPQGGPPPKWAIPKGMEVTYE